MACSHKKLSGSEVEIFCGINPEEFRVFEKDSLKEFSETTDIKGFRKGQAPPEVLKQHISQDKLMHRAAEMAVQKFYPEYVKQEKLEVIGPPEITILKLASGNPFEFKVKVALLPEIELSDYRSIAKNTRNESRPQEVTPEEVKQALDWLQESKVKLVRKDRPAQLGDKVEIDFQGKKDGVVVEKLISHSHPIILGKTKLIPGLQEALIGMKEGEDKTITITLPLDFSEPSLQGSTIEMKIHITLLQERLLPEVIDDFAKSLGNFASLVELKTSIKNGLQQEKEIKEKDRIRALMADRMAQQAKIVLPAILIEGELDKMFQELRGNLKSMSLEIDQYLTTIGKNQEELRKDWFSDAERRVKTGLVLKEIARRENIEASEKEVNDHVNEYLKNFASSEQTRKEVDAIKLKEYTRGVLRNEKVFEFLEKQ